LSSYRVNPDTALGKKGVHLPSRRWLSGKLVDFKLPIELRFIDWRDLVFPDPLRGTPCSKSESKSIRRLCKQKIHI
jgi:hypothetical protein